MTEEDPDLLAGEAEALDELRGRNRYPAMSERFRLSEELENARYQNNLLTEKCRQLEMERDEARRMYCVMRDGEDGLNCKGWAKSKGWDCFKET